MASAIAVDKAIVDALAAEIEATQGRAISVDLETQTITSRRDSGTVSEIDPRRREGLLQGLESALTLQRDDESKLSGCRPDGRGPWIICQGHRHEQPLQHGQNRRCRRRGTAPK